MAISKIVCFSSDATLLYKKDVFRIMVLPNDYVIHFRYWKEILNVPINTDADVKNLIGQTCLIAFTAGNDLNTPTSQTRAIKNIPLREAEIKDVEITADTGLVHFYLKLGNFKKCDFKPSDPNIPLPNKFVTEVDIENEQSTDWGERVDALKGEFPEKLFYNFRIFQEDGKTKLPVSYSDKDRESYYELSDEKKYIIDFSFFDTTEINKPSTQCIVIQSDDSKSLKVIAPQVIGIGATKDNRRFTLATQSLASKTSFSYLHFNSLPYSDTEKSNFLHRDITLKVEVKKNWDRILIFSLSTILAALSVAYGKLVADKYDLYGTFSLYLAAHTIAVLILGFISAALLYQLVDKK